MMLEEFEKLTGIYPSATLYKAIEEEYALDAYADKQSFCKAYKANRDGIAERICRRANSAEFKAYDDTKAKIAELNAEIERLKSQLEREQEWHDNGVNSNMSDEEYGQLAHSADTVYMSEETAARKIANEFGFSFEKIEICATAERTEKNRHGAIRKSGCSERLPLYYATDWNYIKFKVGGYTYEMVNGELNFVYD